MNRESEVVIRPAVADDVPAILTLLANSAEAQGSPSSLCVDAKSLLRDGFGPQPRFHALLAKVNDRPAGLALYFFQYSTWISTNGLYLEDLYVEPEYRRRGIARALMRELARIARDNDCGRFQWLVMATNESAIRFYESVGAEVAEDWSLMYVLRDGIERLASEDKHDE
jgi:ribosomal protein S18 acetylase RimI-like enzyme